MSLVQIVPTSKRARERVKQHGEQMLLLSKGTFRGELALQVESTCKTWSCEGTMMKWGGWFTDKEIDLAQTLASIQS